MDITPQARGLPFILRADDPETIEQYPHGFEIRLVPDEDADMGMIAYDWDRIEIIPAEPEAHVYTLNSAGQPLGFPRKLAGPFHYQVDADGKFVELKAEGGVIRDE